MNRSVRFLVWLGRFLSVDWQAKLRVFLTGLILWQYAIWFDEYFLSATEWLVRAAIVTVIATEWLLRFGPVWRRAVALVALLSLHVYRLDISLDISVVGARAEEGLKPFLAALSGALWQAALEMHPYVWFALGTAAIHWLLTDWLTERARIAFVTVSAVAIIALVDSYSKLVLWEQAAIIVFAGLGLLIVEHFDKFRKRHPASWAHLREYPGSILLPVVIVLSLAMLAGVLAPNARPLLTDPYTLYKHWKGERVVTGGKGIPSGTVTLVNTLSAESGYSRDDRFLGEGFNYDYSTVMRITTDQPAYWRGETKSFYTGSGWTDSEEERSDPFVLAMSGEPLPAYKWEAEPPAGRTVTVRQQVTVFGEDPDFPVLFGAAGIRSVRLGSGTDGNGGQAISREASREPSGETASAVVPDDTYPSGGAEETGPVGIWSPRQGELFWVEGAYPRMYSVESAVPVTDEEGWRSVPMEAFARLYEENGELWAPYLQLPKTLPERVRALAGEIAAGAETPYDMVKSIERFLQTNYPYSNRPDLSKGQSADFVDRFLFEIREGYCDYFSTAMAVMVRSIGFPARWVKGFKTGVSELELLYNSGTMPNEAMLKRLLDGEGTYVVRNADAHSWVEVYFPGYGWIPFEPTSGFALPVVRDPEQAETATAPTASGAAGEAGTDAADEADPLVSFAVFAVLAALAAIAVLYRLVGRTKGAAAARRWRWRISFGGKPQADLNDMALGEATRILKWLGRKGYPREPHETLREAVCRWTEQNRRLKPEFERLAAVVERARYSPNGVTAEDVADLESIFRRLKEQLKS